MGSQNEMIKNKIPSEVTYAEEEEETQAFALQLTAASLLPMILKASIELNIFEIMSTFGPNAFISPTDIVSKLPTKNPDAPVIIDRMLRLLTCHSVLNCSVQKLSDGHVRRLYGLAPVCKHFIKNEDGASLAHLCLVNQDKVYMESWYYLKDAVLEGGIPFNKAYGMSGFEYHGKDPRFNKVFNKAMSDLTTITMKEILDTYEEFNSFESIVDVGGGIGECINMIVSKYPKLKGINFDLTHVIVWVANRCPRIDDSRNLRSVQFLAETVIKDAPIYNGVEHVQGDMFESVPKADAVILKLICHDWSDEHCIKLLKNCYDAIPSNGKVIIADCILPESLDTSMKTKAIVQVDNIMLAHNLGGKERTEKEFQSLANSVGFEGFRVFPNAIFTIIELSKKG